MHSGMKIIFSRKLAAVRFKVLQSSGDFLFDVWQLRFQTLLDLTGGILFVQMVKLI